eukprot:CAMPEP_0185031922 /NCGR_PEP_ID=MMETSP1103-20130426/19666_1 /TAXON_ID=36769 /ORGANISM="Paraphysomonas bandaiensis, Strain Caron Lab Isolate" /LENGTH=248 /DNA_ID=CAMNT_0027567617 /DNA_START=50 /DNA_END=796 /DNA_ORIENTATION=-
MKLRFPEKNWEIDHLIPALNSGVIFMDNPKTGTRSVRREMERSFGAKWEVPRHSVGHRISPKCVHGGVIRHMSTCYTTEQLQNKFIYAFARDPVHKFESGVREARNYIPALRNMTGDEVLEMQIKLHSESPGKWVNTHLQPSTYRLITKDLDGKFLPLSYVGALENIAVDWGVVVKEIEKYVSKNRSGRLRSPLPRSLPLTHKEIDKDLNNSTFLSDKGVRMMCQSELYKYEWECLGYPIPPQCAELL